MSADKPEGENAETSVGEEQPVLASTSRHSNKRHKVHDVAEHKKNFREHELARRAKSRKQKLQSRHGKVKKHEDEVAKKAKLEKDTKAVAKTVQMSQAKLLKEKHLQSVKAKEESQVANEDK